MRVLPWLLTYRDRDPLSYERYFNCGKCMERTPTQIRQRLGCGFEPRIECHPPDFEGRPCDPETGQRVHPTTVCPGYSCGLPEVVEASHARLWFQNGQLTEFCERQPSTKPLRAAITEVEVASSLAEAWAAKNPVKS